MTGFNQPGTVSGAPRPAYTQTYAPAVRVHALNALSTAVVVTLLTDTPGLFNTTNATVNELKQVVNQLVDDLQALGLVG